MAREIPHPGYVTNWSFEQKESEYGQAFWKNPDYLTRIRREQEFLKNNPELRFIYAKINGTKWN